MMSRSNLPQVLRCSMLFIRVGTFATPFPRQTSRCSRWIYLWTQHFVLYLTSLHSWSIWVRGLVFSFRIWVRAHGVANLPSHSHWWWVRLPPPHLDQNWNQSLRVQWGTLKTLAILSVKLLNPKNQIENSKLLNPKNTCNKYCYMLQ